MASKLSISKERTAELVKEFGKGEGDSGSPEVQVAILTERSATSPSISRCTRRTTTLVEAS